MLKSSFFSLGLLYFPTIQALPTQECPILGPSFPSSFDITTTKSFRDAKSSFPKRVEALFSSGLVNRTGSAFTIDVFSTVTNSSIHSYYHAGSALKDTLVGSATDDGTIMRIGSVAKLYTIYAILVHAGMNVLNHPVTRYLPELAGNAGDDPIERIIWEDITVGALASQQGGTGGFAVETAGCFAEGGAEACSREDFLTLMRNKRPIIQAHHDPIYSDAGFGVLTQVLERMTNLTYSDAIQEIIGGPLGLNSSTAVIPPEEGLNAVVLPGNVAVSAWGYDNPVTAGSGGIYSTPSDLRAFGLSILQSRLLSPVSTRHWMKPLGHTATLMTSIGAPWEIERLTLPVSPGSERTRVSDLYTKAGGQSGYAAVFALSPDHGIGFSVMVAGAGARSERYPLRDAVGTAFVVAAEHAAAENAQNVFAGTYIDERAEGTNLTVTVDQGRAGLGLPRMFVNGSEWRPNLFGPGTELPARNVSVRMYPTITYTQPSEGEGGNLTTQISFRAVPQLIPVRSTSQRAEGEGGVGLFDNGCGTVYTVGFNNDDDFVFDVDGEGRTVGVRGVGVGTGLMRRVK